MLIIPFLSYVFVTSFTPGPNNIVSMSNANKYGYRGTLNFILGVVMGFFIIILLSSYFNLFLYRFIPRIKLAMSILGSLYMLYLAVKIIRSKSAKKGSDYEKLNSFYTGFVLQFINPKGILYGITVVSTFIIPYYKSNISLILFSLLLAFVGFLSTSCWAIFGSLFQRFLSKYERTFNITMGLLLMYSAFSIYVKS